MNALARVSEFTPELPTQETFDVLANLLADREYEIQRAERSRRDLKDFDRRWNDNSVAAEYAAAVRAGIRNQITQAELRRVEVEIEIVNVAAGLVAERAAAELLATR